MIEWLNEWSIKWMLDLMPKKKKKIKWSFTWLTEIVITSSIKKKNVNTVNTG